MRIVPFFVISFLLAGPALAQQVTSAEPKPAAPPELEATEGLLIGELTAHRNAEARAVSLTRVVNGLMKQADEAAAKLAASDQALREAQAQMKKDAETIAALKAVPVPPVQSENGKTSNN